MKYEYIYGPVPSWRLGRSLGIDAVSSGKEKICSFDCTYCQVGKTKILDTKRKVFIPTRKIIKEVKSLPKVEIDYITFSGKAEPTLAKNLGDIIKEIRKVRPEKIAVLTNSSIIDRGDVREDLALADFVLAKIDADSERVFRKVNRPPKEIKFNNIIKGLIEFKALYKGKFALQLMFVEENKAYAKEIAELAREINPVEIQINTPLRPCGVTPLSEKDLEKIEKFFENTNYINVYNKKREI